MPETCYICKNEAGESFLKKVKGTYIRVNGKLKLVCSDCQRKYKNQLKKEL